MDMAGGLVGLFSILSLLIPIGTFVFAIYIALQFLKETRERNELLYQILNELRKKNS